MLARALAGLAAACLAASLGAAPPFPEPVDVGNGVHVFFGARDEASRANGGHIANQGFIVAPGGVIVIDSGLSAGFAEHMLRAIRARTGKPLAILILTWPMDEAIFGATVFQEQGIQVYAHEAASRLIAERCQRCLEIRTAALGGEIMAGTRVPRPERLFNGSQPLAVAGRQLELLDESGAAAPGSIAVWDRESGVLFAGGLASFGRIPETRDGNLAEWIRALQRLSRIPARRVIPAHGWAGSPADLNAVAAYLGGLERRTQEAYAAGASLLEAPRTVAVDEYRHWALYESVHPRNVHHAYIALERRELEDELPASRAARP
jgi:glyoxylase-like metal-dependent hydrolase (beta-lactamase superfamily II)